MVDAALLELVIFIVGSEADLKLLGFTR